MLIESFRGDCPAAVTKKQNDNPTALIFSEEQTRRDKHLKIADDASMEAALQTQVGINSKYELARGRFYC